MSVEVERRRTTPAGPDRSSHSESNQLVFSAGARLTGVVAGDAPPRRRLTVKNTFDMTATGLDVQLAISGVRYVETTGFSGSAADAGLFERRAGAIEFHPTAEAAQPGFHPVRLVVNGAESQPFWIETT